MDRNIKKYAELGKKRALKEHSRYDLSSGEMNYFLNEGFKDSRSMFYALIDAYHLGIEAGARMTEKRYKEGRC